MQIVGWKTFCELVGMRQPAAIKNAGWISDPITDNQKKFIRSMGVGPTGLKTKGQASTIINVLKRRCEHHLATPGQLTVLREYRIDPEEYRKMTRTDVEWYLAHMKYKSRLPEYIAARKSEG